MNRYKIAEWRPGWLDLVIYDRKLKREIKITEEAILYVLGFIEEIDCKDEIKNFREFKDIPMV